ncbi:MAG: acylneuraminate cytidylyltransferase family protein, partial [Thermodesulfobacteriota bacterium]|nr:acylneuraminate cytidylyltransferase family protein [Thermodesulfobacteriota bacterium]
MEKRPRTLAIIPARGGSKRLPGKNIRLLAGKPLIAHTIAAAQKATLLTDWLVSSEDRDIIRAAKEYGGNVPFVRPKDLAGDEVRNIEVALHALKFMEERTGKPYDMVLLLQPTCPVRDPAHIDEAVRLLWESPLDTLAGVKGPFKKRDPYVKRISDGRLSAYCSKEPDKTEPFYLYNASIYAAKRDYFLKNKKLV